MPSGVSKRQQLRNEKALADLIRTVPGNDRCADCDALTPGWASWNMGIFLCMRCAAIHRKLGTHISKVKSLSMDTWSSEQVDNMKSHGNLLMNKIFNPKNIKPPVPTDIDEADSCMERFIRQKYQYRSLEDGKPKPPSREDESYTRSHERREDRREERQGRQRSYDDLHRGGYSPEGSPPPLPPKSGKFFGFGLRSASSTSNLRRFGTKSKESQSPTYDQRSWSPPPRQTTGLGATVADVTTDSFEAKMAALRDMGFKNDRRNEMVLRGLNENLDKSIETLVRLGEGTKPASRAITPVPATNAATSAGASAAPKSAPSPDPFDMPTATTNNPAQQQPQSTSYNPFDQQAQAQTPQSAQHLEASFQNLQVSQPLFPHSTGGYPAQTGLMPQATYQQPITPPATSTFQNGYMSSPQPMDTNHNPFFQPVAQPQGGMGAQSFPNLSAQQNNPFFNATPQTHNPYLQPQAQQNAFAQSMNGIRQPQHANTMPAISSTSPFGTSPFGTSPFGQAPSFQTQPQQLQPQQPQQFQPQTQPQATAPGSYNPFQQSMGPQSAGGYPNQLQPQQLQQQLPQHTARMDKTSILSLYSLNQASSTIPSIPEQSQYQIQPGAGTSPAPPLTNSLNSTPMTQSGSNIQTPQPGTNGSVMASRNPFGAATVGSGLAAQAGVTSFSSSSGLGIGMGTNGAQSANGMKTSPFSGPPPVNVAFQPRTHMSQPSVDINGLQSGRHSPDAFASLSARYG